MIKALDKLSRELLTSKLSGVNNKNYRDQGLVKKFEYCDPDHGDTGPGQ